MFITNGSLYLLRSNEDNGNYQRRELELIYASAYTAEVELLCTDLG